MSMMAAISPQPESSTDGWETTPQIQNKRRNQVKRRLYLGNLPPSITLEDVQELLPHDAVDKTTSLPIEVINTSKSSRAYVNVTNDDVGEALIAKLNQTVPFSGCRAIAVDWEQIKKKTPSNRRANPKGKSKGRPGNNNSNNPFGKNTKSWSKPATQPTAPPPTTFQEASERIEAIVQEETSTAENSQDPMTSLLATTAAVSLVAEGGFNVASSSQNDVNTASDDTKSTAPVFDTQQPLSALLAEYGDFDPNWKQQKVSEATPSNTVIETQQEQQKTPAFENRLGIHGKAPIHVDFCTFGYHHGAPAAIRQGWSHAQPLGVTDTSHLPTVPPHLAWQDGASSGLVKRLLLEFSEGGIRTLANELAQKAATAVQEAMKEEGYGYTQPLSMAIYVGSEYGKHRAVVCAEFAATALRKLLRANDKGQFTAPVSVGTQHRDVNKTAAIPGKKKKTTDDDDDDGW